MHRRPLAANLVATLALFTLALFTLALFTLALFACQSTSSTSRASGSEAVSSPSEALAQDDIMGQVSSATTPTATSATATSADGPLGFGYTLEAADTGAPVIAKPPADAQPLSEADTAALFANMDPLPTLDPHEPPRPPADPKPRPRPGQVVQHAFDPTPDATAPEIAVEALRVVRSSPDADRPGPVSTILLQFSQPMVPLASVDDTSKTIPATMTPEAPGTWRWLDPTTLVFESGENTRLPMATTFRVRVPAGTKSALGGVLAQEFALQFSTAAPTPVSIWPGGGTVDLRSHYSVRFDQRVPAAKAVQSLRFITSRGKEIEAELSEPTVVDPVKSSADARQSWHARWVADAPEGTAFSFRPKSALPADTDVTLQFRPGLPSSEGPNLTQREHSYGFQVRGPLRLKRKFCGWNDNCGPGQPFTFEFSHELDPYQFDARWVQVTPKLPDLDVSVSGNQLSVNGVTRAGQVFEIRVEPALVDAFGQTLDSTVTATWKVDKPEPGIALNDNFFIPLPADGDGKLPAVVSGLNRVRMSVREVSPDDFAAARETLRTAMREDKPSLLSKLSGEIRFDGDVDVPFGSQAAGEMGLPIREHLSGKTGHAIVVVQQPRQGLPIVGSRPFPLVRWVQLSDLAPSFYRDMADGVAWVSRRSTGAPVPGAALRWLGQGTDATTDATGVATVPLIRGEAAQALVVESGSGSDSDSALLVHDTYVWGTQGFEPRASYAQVATYAFTDRGLYRPGETVRIKGTTRRITPGPSGTTEMAPVGLAVHVRASDPRGNQLLETTIKLDTWGGFTFDVPLPVDCALGSGNVSLEMTLPGSSDVQSQWVHFSVQEFRRPELEVSVSSLTETHILRGSSEFELTASYFTGGTLPDTAVHWTAEAHPSNYVPPGHSNLQFGPWRPWRFYAHEAPGDELPRVVQLDTRTDALGRSRVRAEWKVANPARPWTLSMTGEIRDLTRQAWSGRTSALVHPSTAYVGIRRDRAVGKAGEESAVDLLVVDIDGNTIAGRPIELVVERASWSQVKGEWIEQREVVSRCQAVSADALHRCVFTPDKGGRYDLRATTSDAQGRPNFSESVVWVSGVGLRQTAADSEVITLTADKTEYEPGETARVLVMSKRFPGEGILTVRREGLVEERRVTLADSSIALDIPIPANALPQLDVQFDLLAKLDREDDPGAAGTAGEGEAEARPMVIASARTALAVSTAGQRLTIQVEPSTSHARPGATAPIQVTVTDAAGKPVAGAQVALLAVDEAVLALAGYSLSDPLAAFFPRRADVVNTHHLVEMAFRPSVYSRIRLMSRNGGQFGAMPLRSPSPGGGGRGEAPPPPAVMALGAMVTEDAVMGDAAGGDMDGRASESEAKLLETSTLSPESDTPAEGGDASPKASLRKRFDALAHYAPALTTDAQGRVSTAIELPDSLTRYRIWAVAADQPAPRFGKGESTLTAALPLMVRPQPPRFSRVGDRIELPIVIQNTTDAALRAKVGVRTAGTTLLESGGKSVTVPAGDRVEVRFSALSPNTGTSVAQIIAAADTRDGAAADAAQVEWPNLAPASTEAFAVYGSLDAANDESVGYPVQVPAGALSTYGGLEISTATTQLQSLTDAVLYLVAYPFECSEQLASRILAIAALRDVLEAFEAEGLPERAELESAVARDLARLDKIQQSDGGFGFWRKSDTTWPYLSIHVAHSLARAREKGFEVSDAMIQRSLGYLRAIRRKIPSHYPKEARPPLEAYALYVRMLLGDRDSAAAEALVQSEGVDQLGLDTAGWLLAVVTGGAAPPRAESALVQRIVQSATETAATATFATHYQEAGWLLLHSDRRTDAIVLDALLRARPDHPLIAKTVRGLLGHRTKGRWRNTQENSFVLLAMDQYFRTYEKAEPDLVVRSWLGDQQIGRDGYQGRSTDTKRTVAPMAWLQERAQAAPGENPLFVVAAEGAGRLYYRLGLRYAPQSADLAARSAGFAVERSYSAVESDDDVRQDDDGTWHVRAGALVRVRLQMIVPSRRTHVALVDPLPAGFEPLNPALAMQHTPHDAEEANDDTPIWWRWWRWYEHDNLRDDRVEVFSSFVPAGTYSYTYYARATTPGQFVAPPTKAEEMYEPETFGRAASSRVVVE